MIHNKTQHEHLCYDKGIIVVKIRVIMIMFGEILMTSENGFIEQKLYIYI